MQSVFNDHPTPLPHRPDFAPITAPNQNEIFSFSDDEITLKNKIAFLGDNLDDIIKQIDELAHIFIQTSPTKSHTLIDILLECVSTLTIKTGMYAALVGLVHTEKPEFTHKLLESLSFEFDVNFKRGSYSKCALLIRFCVALACCYVITFPSLFTFLDALMDLSSHPDFASNPEASDYPIYLVMSSLFWISTSEWSVHRTKIDDFIEKSKNYLANRTTPWQFSVGFFIDDRSNFGTFTVKDRLHTLIESFESFTEYKWQSKVTFRFYQSRALSERMKANENGPKYDLCVSTPNTHTFIEHTSPMASVLRLPVTNEDPETLLTSHDRWILEEHFLLTIFFFKMSVQACAKSLLSFPIQDDQFDFVLGECVLSEMLRLPKFPSSDERYDCPFFYFRLLHQIHQYQNSFGEKLEKLLQSIVKKIVDFDEECFELLVEFYAYWLSVTWLDQRPDEFWGEFRGEGGQRFLRRFLRRLTRLNYTEDVANKLPPTLAQTLPGNAPTCNWLSDKPTSPFEFRKLRELMKTNLRAEDLPEIQQEIFELVCYMIGNKHWSALPTQLTPNSEEPQETEDNTQQDDGKHKTNWKFEYYDSSQPWTFEEAIQLFMTALLAQGHKTLTHMNRMIENYAPILNELKPSSLIKQQSSKLSVVSDQLIEMDDSTYYQIIIKVIYQFWFTHSIRITATLKSLIVSDYLPYTSVFRFILFELSEEHLDATHNWEICHQIIENGLLVTSLHESNYKVALRKKNTNIDELEKHQNYIKEASFATRQMLLYFMATMMFKFEYDSPHPSIRKQILPRIMSFGRRYFKYFTLQECIEKAEIYSPSPVLQSVIENLEIFGRFYYKNLSTK